MLAGIVWLAGIVILLATAMQLLASRWWMADIFSQFTVQYVLLLVPIVIVMMVLRHWRSALLLTLPLMVNGWLVRDYVPGFPEPLNDRPRSGQLRIMTQNVLTSNTRYQELCHEIERFGPDVIALQEVDQLWMDALSGLQKEYPYICHASHPGNFGIALLSRIPWQTLDVQRFGPDELPSLHVSFMIEGRYSLEFVNVHPLPPLSGAFSELRNGQLLSMAGGLDQSRSRIVVGDFNLTPWSPWFREMLRRGELGDSARRFTLEPTWYAFPGWLGGVLIDHVLVSPDLIVQNYRVGGPVGSDHRAVVVDIGFADK
jgi:endonuclease/exonuclease/phosphatase (EEP) superfamily protein YafD